MDDQDPRAKRDDFDKWLEANRRRMHCGHLNDEECMREAWYAALAASVPAQPVALPAAMKHEPLRGDEPVQDQEVAAAFVNGWNACLKACHAAPVPQEVTPQIEVWFGSMPESNGRENWTVTLRRKARPENTAAHDLHRLMSGVSVYRSEYKDRARYEADCLRFLLGEINKAPHILDYDADLRSDYATAQAVAQPFWRVPGESYCLVCKKLGHFTTDCNSTHSLNTPEDRELGRLCDAAHAAPVSQEVAPDLAIENEQLKAEILTLRGESERLSDMIAEAKLAAQAVAQPVAPAAGVIAAKLFAMAANYSGGHMWDDLDADVCRQAAQLLSTAPTIPPQGEQPVAPAGWSTVFVKNLGPLVDAMERTDRKGYMPDAMAEEWESFGFMLPEDAAAPTLPQAAAQEAPAPAAHVEPNNDKVICPKCCHQFRAIPVNVQAELRATQEAPAEVPKP